MPAGQPLSPRAPERPSLSGQARQTDKAQAQLDRRIDQQRTREILAHVGPDTPGRKTGRLWLRPRTGTT